MTGKDILPSYLQKLREQDSFAAPDRAATGRAAVADLDKNAVQVFGNRKKTAVHHSHLNLSDPTWPKVPPVLRKDCKVVFRDPNLSVCHIVPWGANFGDEIGPPVVKRILELHFGCSADSLAVFDMAKLGRSLLNRTGHPEVTNCLMTVGSLWRMILTGDHVWGTGVAFSETVQQRCTGRNKRGKAMAGPLVKNLTIYSSRGPLSVADTTQFCDFVKKDYSHPIEPAGDPGFLVPFLFPEHITTTTSATMARKSNQSDINPTTKVKKEVCLIPHHQTRGHAMFKMKMGPKRQILTVRQSWENMILVMQGCERIVSSSLHGIILAEALGIPNRRVQINTNPGDFKFDDFYVSYRGSQPALTSNLTVALDSMMEPLSDAERDAYARRVLKTFPLHLFHAVTDDATGV
jgi:hypothetical protein